MGTKIKEGVQIEEIREDMLFAVGNTDIDQLASVASAQQIKAYTDSDKAEVAFTGSYLSLTDTPVLQSYVTINTLNQNYYNKNQVNQMIGGVSGAVFKITDSLPEVGENNVIYLVPQEGEGGVQNYYDEYVWLPDGTSYEKIGSTEADFSNYYTISQVNALIPTVNNPTITFRQGSTTVGSITLNQSGNSTLTFSSVGAAQVQADWNQTNNQSVDYIKNKPSIPTVNDPRITFTQGGVTVGAFTLNQSSADTIDLSDISQVQADWDERDTTSAAYIQNKPSIPTVNNPTITFTQGGVTVGSISLNQSSGATIAFTAGGSGGVQSNWLENDTTALSYIQNKPTVPSNTRSLLVTYDNNTTETIVVYVQ